MRNVVRLGVWAIVVLGLACQQQVERVGGVQHSEAECDCADDGFVDTSPYYLKYSFSGDAGEFDAAIKLVTHVSLENLADELDQLGTLCTLMEFCSTDGYSHSLGMLYVKNLSTDAPVEKFEVYYQSMVLGFDDSWISFGDAESGAADNRWQGKLIHETSPLSFSCCDELEFVDGSRDDNAPRYTGEEIGELTAAEWRELTGEDS